MLKKREFIIYLTIILSFIAGVFLFVPAVATQKQISNGHEDQRDIRSKVHTTGLTPQKEFPAEGTEDIKGILKALEDRERELSRREDAVKKEEERLNMLKNMIELSLKQYSAMRDKLQKDLAGGGSNRPQQGIMHMAKIYETMSVEDAAQRIEKMDADLAVELLSRIKSKQAGKILGAVTPEKAASLSAKMASKRGDE